MERDRHIEIHTDSGTLRWTVAAARQYVADYRHSEDRDRRGIALDVLNLLEEMEAREN